MALGMDVRELLEIAADHEQVKEFFVNDNEVLCLVAGDRVMHRELELDRRARLQHSRGGLDLDREIRQRERVAGDEVHVAARAFAGLGLHDVGVHRAHVGGRRRWLGWGGRLRRLRGERRHEREKQQC